MIDFSLTDENKLVRDTARAFVEAEILPNIRDWDAGGEVHREIFEKMGDLGFLGAPIPEHRFKQKTPFETITPVP